MFKRLLFLLSYLIAWVIFFELARLTFIFSQWQFAGKLSTGSLLNTMFFGLKMDISMAAYITLPVCLFVLLSGFLPFLRKPPAYVIYSGIMLAAELVLVIADAEIYRAWGHRIDYTPLIYLSSPREAWASVSHRPVFPILLGLVVVFLVLFYLFRKMIGWKMRLLERHDQRWLQSGMVLAFMVFLIIPMRGGLQLSPMNHSAVHFSNNQFANSASVNASWNFMFSLTHRDEIGTNPYLYMPADRAKAISDSMLATGQGGGQLVDLARRPNLILILLESFTSKALYQTIDGIPVTPGFEKLIGEGIFFSNCYSNGDRTAKGLSSVISGYPALPKNSIINFPDKVNALPGLGKILANDGYDTRFYYGGDPEFANMKSYLLSQQFGSIITRKDFSRKDWNSKWGAHDDVVMRKLVEDMGQFREPFFTTLLTLSSHEPFETPGTSAFHGNKLSTKLMNSLHYMDSCLYAMISAMKEQDWWNNTVVVLMADHGHYEPATGKRADDYRIPLLWLGGALKEKGLVIDRTVSQLDVAGTLAGQMGYSTRYFPFSRNLFDGSAGSWAFFTYNDGIGFMTDSSRLMYDNLTKSLAFEEGSIDPEQVRIARALMQAVYADFLGR